jgi:excisionase family DNA binding protein
MDDPNELLTIGQAAEVLQVAVSTVRRWADQSVLPSVRIAGGPRRFRRFHVEALLETSSTEASSS